MPLPNQTVKKRKPIMLNIKTSDPYDLKPVELTPAELDSVAGGGVKTVVIGVFKGLVEIQSAQTRALAEALNRLGG
jgi:hypothetical protein